jgi:phage/plasmid-like protein (TIGR03299 family)
MPHNIATVGGQSAMMAVGDPPWHRLGTLLNRPATALEAIEAARLNWEVRKAPLLVCDAGSQHPVRDRFAVVRDRTPAAAGIQGALIADSGPVVLGIVGPEYVPLQNRQAFGWFDQIVGQGEAVYHTAGALGEGERVWVLAKLPDSIQVVGDDVADKYLLLSNSHDGSSSVQVKFTPIRVVCQNTLTMALSGGPGIRISHTKSMPARLVDAIGALGIIRRRFGDIASGFRMLAGVQLDGDRLADYLRRVYPEPRDSDGDSDRERVRRIRKAAEQLFTMGRGNEMSGVRGTLWAAYNGVAELVDHSSEGPSRGSRLESIWFGSGYLTKARAYRIAIDRATAWRN